MNCIRLVAFFRQPTRVTLCGMTVGVRGQLPVTGRRHQATAAHLGEGVGQTEGGSETEDSELDGEQAIRPIPSIGACTNP